MTSSEFDAICFGGGSGLTAAYYAQRAGKRVAVVEKGPLGGTCVNRGCIPTKGLIQAAEVAKTIREAHKFHVGVDTSSIRVDFPALMAQVRQRREKGSASTRGWVESDMTLFDKLARFVSEKTLQSGGETLTAPTVFLATGARPSVPPVPGLDKVPYLTNEGVLELTRQPEELAILGGGYIGVEFGHFFAEIGTKVTVIEHSDCILREDQDVRTLFTQEFAKKVDLRNDTRAVEVSKNGTGVTVSLEHNGTGNRTEVDADALLVATGRRPNTDAIGLEATGIETNERGWIKVDDHLETTEKGTYAYGDVIGQGMFKHTSSYEGELAWRNSQGAKLPVSYRANPHAIFSDPQVGTVGLTEEECRDRGLDFRVGKLSYDGVMKGRIVGSPPGLAKAIIENGTDRILGFHLVGPHAADLIAEVVVAMNAGDGTAKNVLEAIHVHPTMPELVKEAFVKAGPSAGSNGSN